MNQANLESLHVQVQRAAQAYFRSAKDQDPVSYLCHTLAERAHVTGTYKGFPQKITHPVNKDILGRISGAEVIFYIDRFKTAPVEAKSVKQMDTGTVSLVIT